MTRSTEDSMVCFHAGEIIGLLMRHHAEDYERVAANTNSDLRPEYRRVVRLLAELRRKVEGRNV